jgi:hypothetical protein
VKRTVPIVAALVVACAAMLAGAAASRDAEYRVSELCAPDWAIDKVRQERPRLVVHAIDRSGTALNGARVSVAQNDEKTAETDAAGHTVFEGLGAGRARLLVHMDGFREVHVTVRLRPGCVTALLVPMEVGLLGEERAGPSSRRQP